MPQISISMREVKKISLHSYFISLPPAQYTSLLHRRPQPSQCPFIAHAFSSCIVLELIGLNFSPNLIQILKN